MFKLGYQAFILMSIVSGYAIVNIVKQKNKKMIHKIYLMGLLPLLFLVLLYPYFAVKSYFGELKEYHGLWGMEWMQNKYPDDLAGVNWLNKVVVGQPVIMEAAGDSYTDYERVSMLTGLPTVAGWAVHEWLWRGSYDPIAKRAADVAVVYESDNLAQAKTLLDKYNVKYVFVGDLEREKYKYLNEENIAILARQVFVQGKTRIYEVTR